MTPCALSIFFNLFLILLKELAIIRLDDSLNATIK